MIPAGATHIRVTDNSRNYLGKTMHTKHTHMAPGMLCISVSALCIGLPLRHWLHGWSVNPGVKVFPRLAITSSPQRQWAQQSYLVSGPAVCFSGNIITKDIYSHPCLWDQNKTGPQTDYTVVLKGDAHKRLYLTTGARQVKVLVSISCHGNSLSHCWGETAALYSQLEIFLFLTPNREHDPLIWTKNVWHLEIFDWLVNSE